MTDKTPEILEYCQTYAVEMQLPWGAVSEIALLVGRSRSHVSKIISEHGYNSRRAPRPPMQHGTLAMYAKGKCRCEDCAAAWSNYYKLRRLRLKAERA